MLTLICGCSITEKNSKSETVLLSSLDITKMSAGWGKTIANKSIQEKVLTIAGKTFETGVGTHANSIMYIDLNKGSKSFSAFVGVDDEVNGKVGSVKFRVFGDGRELFNSGVIKAGEPAKKVEVDLRGVGSMVLIATSAGDGISYDHANWVDAKFEVVGKAPVAVDMPKEEAVILTPKPGPNPRINGPKVYGARPGNPFIFRIPATGDRPMKFSANGLPSSLKLDKDTGIITGDSPAKAGEYTVTLKAVNKSGKDTRQFKIVVGDTLALTPPMGWNSWYIHYNRVTDADMRAAADVMIESGMADFGYQYVNIDDCWMRKLNTRNADKADFDSKGWHKEMVSTDERLGGPARDEAGNLLPNKDFPDMFALTEYIHGLGLKAGIYISPGPWTCQRYVGSWKYEQQDADMFALWGFDFLKYDWCGYSHVSGNGTLEELKLPYEKMCKIVEELDRDFVFNLCQYGWGEVWKWGGEVGGHCWRTTGDLGLMSGYMEVGLSNARHYEYAKPGQWNDPDYILIGWVGNAHGMGEGKKTQLTGNQQYQYMSMWSLMASPLIFSGDMTKLDDFTINILCNAEIIDVDQDPLGKQGRIIKQTEDYFVMVKDLEDGSKAVGLFNTSPIESVIAVDLSEIGLDRKCKVRDLWRQKDIGTVKDTFETKVPTRGVVMVKISK